MRATGVVRKLDNLGRIVIPKEIRKTLRIRDGEPLEIFTGKDGEVILKKYSPIEELGAYAVQYAEALYQTLGHSVLITDTDQVVSAAGVGKKEATNKKITTGFDKVLNSREQQLLLEGERNYVEVYQEQKLPMHGILVTPIMYEGDVIGSIIIIQRDVRGKLGELERKIALVGATYLGNQMQ